MPLVGALRGKVASLRWALDSRMAFRLSILMAGMLMADELRTVCAWLVAAGVEDDWDRFYAALQSIGRASSSLGQAVLWQVLAKFDPGLQGRLLVGIDDTPTKRYGKHVEGAGVHHHPTPGPADAVWRYGHNWVVLALLARSRWGTFALPLLSRLYVRQVDVPPLEAKYGWKFRTKLELAKDLVLWFVRGARARGIQAKVWVVTDGAYAARCFLDAVCSAGVVVVSRLRKDAKLFDLPGERVADQRGRRAIYGKQRIRLDELAASPDGWTTTTYSCRGSLVTRQYKSFQATSRLVRGVIRVVLVRFEDHGWAAYFCTDPTATVLDVLTAVADRWALEECFHDLKEVWGAGQQQVRNLWSNIGCWHLHLWMMTLVELCCWDRDRAALVDRRQRPWDNADRRPSHADRRRAIRREMLEQQFLVTLPQTPDMSQFRTVLEQVPSLCV